MTPIECEVCHKTIKTPTKWHIMIHEKLSERHKQYLKLKNRES